MFKINGVWWRLIFVPPYHPVLMNDNGQFTLGATIHENRTIYLSDELYGEKLHHVLSHELFHAEMMSRGVYVDPYIEECLADLVADHAIEIFDMADSAHRNLCRLYGRC